MVIVMYFLKYHTSSLEVMSQILSCCAIAGRNHVTVGLDFQLDHHSRRPMSLAG